MKEVATALAGERLNTVQSWFQRGHFKFGELDQRAEKGFAHAISLRTALQVGIAWHLYEAADIHPAKGAEIARAFTHEGDDGRDPGELFDKNFTVLIAYPKLSAGRVVNCTSKTPLVESFQAEQHGRQYAAIVVWLNFIDRDLRVALLQAGKGTET
ncbi:MAG TPA: hypothetical protein VN838_11360 [Bradyrhizobium sp.]|nr:hypothetical protein [Bradyrhizobium sp.]